MSQEWVQKQLQLFTFDFDKADRNKNGTLSSSELLTVLRAQGFNGTDDEAQMIFKHLDRDGNRSISKQEFSDAIKSLPKTALKEFALRKLFKSLDTDGSGYLTEEEIKKAIKNKSVSVDLPDHVIDEIMKVVSRDSDQKLNYEEFLSDFKVQTLRLEMRTLFKKLDTNGNGRLTRKEIEQALKTDFELKLSKDKINDLLSGLIHDLDEEFSYEEFLDIWLRGKGQKTKETVLRWIFKTLDKDKSGYLTKEEITKATKDKSVSGYLSDDIIKHILDAVSKDGDNKLNYEEFLRDFKLEAEALEMRLVFQELDSDKNGSLTWDEINQMFVRDLKIGLTPDEAGALVIGMCGDKDQKINYNEFIKVWMDEKKRKAKATA